MLGGLALTSLGAAWCFSLNGFSFVAVIISLLLLQMRPILAKPGASLLSSMKEGIAFIRGKKEMVPLIVLAFLMTFLGVPLIVFLPVVARDIFHMGASTYTLLLCTSGAGSVAGALMVAAFGHIPNKGQATLMTLVVLGALITAFALSRSLILTCILLFLAGAALIAVFSMISSLVQLIAPDEMRGRVMSVYNVAFRGGMPIGALITGALVPIFTVPVVLAVNGVLLSCLGLYFLLIQRQVARL
jgi:predicted MFS family arabinose efflux permease